MIKAIKKLFKPNSTVDKMKREQHEAKRKIETLSTELDAKVKMIEELNARLTAMNARLEKEIAEKEESFERLRGIVDELSIRIYNLNETHSLTIAEKDKMIRQLQSNVTALDNQLLQLKQLDSSPTD